MRVGSIFSGAGLGDLGLTWAGFDHEWFCELAEYQRKVLALRWPGAPVYTDVTELKGNDLPPVDILIGGFPCQAFSSAARGRNIAEKDRKAELVRLADEMRPQWVVGENVKRSPVESVAADLRGLGYRTSVFNLESAQVGADHQRSRWWVCAYADNEGEFHLPINAEVARLSEIRRSFRGWPDYARAVRASSESSNRVHRLECLGNGQDPFVTLAIGRAIQKVETTFSKSGD